MTSGTTRLSAKRCSAVMRRMLRAAFAIALSVTPAKANLIVNGFHVTDSTTGLEFISPYVTRGYSYNIIAADYAGFLTAGYSIASHLQVLDMINNNFGNPPPSSAPTQAAFPGAAAFFTDFGINQVAGCLAYGNIPNNCPRTQGWTIDGNVLSGIGMIEILVDASSAIPLSPGSYGGLIDFSTTIASQGNIYDTQRGTWLVRRAATQPLDVPEPSAAIMFGIALIGFALISGRTRERRVAKCKSCSGGGGYLSQTA